MPFVLTTVGDVFQHQLDTIYNNLAIFTDIADDMAIWGKQANGTGPDQHFTMLLPVTRQHNLKLKFDKLQYKTKQVTSF